MMTKQTRRVFDALVVNGDWLTAKQIRSRFSIANPYDAVYQLRMSGYPINQQTCVDSKGRVTNKYFLGEPSREVIAAGYKALASSR